jgi:hypothetical protein
VGARLSKNNKIRYSISWWDNNNMVLEGLSIRENHVYYFYTPYSHYWDNILRCSKVLKGSTTEKEITKSEALQLIEKNKSKIEKEELDGFMKALNMLG